MQWFDWCIAVIPMIFVVGLAFYTRKYIKGVADFLAAGRVAGRYVLCVGDMASGLSVITIVALVEIKYQTGYALEFWQHIIAPLGLIMGLTGYCVYRYRETKALSFGQFLEMRYSRSLRVVAASMRAIVDLSCNAIGPAVAANFFVYYLDLPQKISIFGWQVSSFGIIVGLVLILAMAMLWPGGRVSLLVTDCLQGVICYPIFLIIVVYILYNFSWKGEVAPVMMDRVPGESFLNPFDIHHLRDFNLFALVVSVTTIILNRASWIGNDNTSCARTPHEQKMAGILGAWRNGFATMMCVLIAITIITIMSHRNFAPQSKEIRDSLSEKIANEIAIDDETRTELISRVNAIPQHQHQIGVDEPLSQAKNLDTPYMEAATGTFGDTPQGNLAFQKFRTLYKQMMMPVVLRNMLPPGLVGIFALLMLMLLVTTDDSRIFNVSSTIMQDIVLPFLKKPLTPEQHVLYLRISSLLVALFFFIVSLFFVHLDYINLFGLMVASFWLGGAGPVMVFGLYSRFGTTAGAFASLFAGSGVSLVGLLLQRNWADHVYPWLDKMGWAEGVGRFFQAASRPFNPFIVWEMNPVKFPVNSNEIFFIAMLLSLSSYVVVSLITCRQPYDLDRLLHRGKYQLNGEKKISSPWTLRNVFSKIIGITPEYSTGDRVIAWGVFSYAFIYQVVISFLFVLIWNLVAPWPVHWWSGYFFVFSIVVPGIVALISTVWFFCGGIRDMKQLFRDLANRVNDPLDNGRVREARDEGAEC
ncbi:MAG: sodium:panthothenate symporter [Lentisphaerae bacterium]|nr:sodium:panthothenate symporter [Lentisphaerota bacterium]